MVYEYGTLENDAIDIIDGVPECIYCKRLPHLVTVESHRYDYNELENLGCVAKHYYMSCPTCPRDTELAKTVVDALSYWSWTCQGDKAKSTIRE